MKRIFGMVLLLLAFAAVVAGCSRETVPLATEETGPVTVTSVDELLSALAPGAEIQLAEGSYTLSGAADYGAEKEDGVYFWEPVEDGYRLVIRGIQGLVIRGSSQETTVLETGANYSAVLGFEECMDVTMENFSINAVPEYQGCCLSLYDCSDIVLENMSLSSSGMMGIRVENSQRITLSDSGIVYIPESTSTRQTA